ADRLRHEPVEVEPAAQVQVDEHGEVPGRQAVAVPARLERPAPAEQLDHRQLDRHRGVGHADLDEGPGQVAGEEGLAVGLGPADRLDDDVGTVAVGQLLDGLDRVDLGGVHGVGGAEALGPLQLAGVDVDGDHGAGAGQGGGGDGGVAHSPAADDRHGV